MEHMLNKNGVVWDFEEGIYRGAEITKERGDELKGMVA